MIELRAQTGPVFLTYRASPTSIDRGDRATGRRRSSTSRRPTACSTRSGASRAGRERSSRPSTRFQRSTSPTDTTARRAPHARDSSCAARRWSRRMGSVLAVAFPDNQMQVLPYNRVVKDLGSTRRSRACGAPRAVS